MLDNLNRRGAAVFGYRQGEPDWPYDTPPHINVHQRLTDRPAYDREVAQARARQEVIVSWAERHGLKASSTTCCLLWLTRAHSRRCTSRDTCGSGPTDRGWFDHPIFWLKDGLPAVVTSVAYGSYQEHRSQIGWWTRAFPLSSERGRGWYGSHSHQVLLWRPDRIRQVEPAWIEDDF
ncbi:hypothetical protein [Streptomyces hydrogenans]|jgi:hypothetical protein|uniref:hypothetical protein n=1 Tax=Streptomyces hydrogenans TaxID=1873719 RepID=UPI0036E56F51